MLRLVIFLFVATAASAIAQICFRLGMREVGELQNFAVMGFVQFSWAALHNLYVLQGTLFAAFSYFFYLAALSLRDLTIVLPLASLDYVMVAFMARYILNENIPSLRWAGIFLIVTGVSLVARSGIRS